MKLLRTHIIRADTCGGLLDGLNLSLRGSTVDYSTFDPLCLVGPNGSGKSQFLQVLAEMFQSALHECAPQEERVDGNPDLQFELEYLTRSAEKPEPVRVRIARIAAGKHRPVLTIETKNTGDWTNHGLDDPSTRALLPRKIIGYTSGENETLSLPFLVSRSGYADEVGRTALHEPEDQAVTDTGLMLIDYGTHIEVLVANLVLGNNEAREALLSDAGLSRLHSFRCIVQLAHRAAPAAPAGKRSKGRPREVLLTQELKGYLDRLKRCATCYSYDQKTETYVLDFWVNQHTEAAFGFFWRTALDLYSSFHKFAMLNDLVIPKKTRERFQKDTRTRRFASRLPEPQDEDKVFRFERVSFASKTGHEPVDYVSLSDGEHQLAQILGTLSMISFPDIVLLLDEPESHFNPQWRVRFISRVLDLPTESGHRLEASDASEQECLLTTHAPFVPSDMSRDKVFIFTKREGRVQVEHPQVETYGTTFDNILDECFDVRPPISKVPLDDIKELSASNDPEEVKAGMDRLGNSIEKVFLADRLRQLTKRGDA